MSPKAWTVRLAAAAEADYDEILRWTAARFGAGQATRYGAMVAAALSRLQAGPEIVGVNAHDDIVSGVMTLHVGRRGRHIILFRVDDEQARSIDVLRVLHEAMDLTRHVSDDDGTV